MGDFERFNSNISYLKTVSGREQPAIDLRLDLEFNRLLRRAIAKDRQTQFLIDGSQTLDVIGMLVRDQDGRQILRGSANAGQTLPYLPEAETCIDEDARFFGL